MKKQLIILILYVVSVGVQAQQRMLHTSQQQIGFMQNPALVGLEDYREVKLLYNQQWSGFDGAPILKGIGFSSPIGKDSASEVKLKSLALPGTKPKAIATSKKSESKNKVGLGASILNESDGTISLSDFMGMASFQFERNKKKFLLGLGAGIIQQSTYFDKLKLVNSSDATFAQQQNSLVMPSFQLSAAYLSTDFFVCVNSKAILEKQFSNPSQTNLQTNTYLSGGFKFKLNEHITAIPSALIRVSSSTANTADIGGIVDYKDLFRLGSLFRTNGDFSTTIGCTYNHLISLMYSFDLTTSQLRTIYGNTHNLVISIRLKKSVYSTDIPKHFWL